MRARFCERVSRTSPRRREASRYDKNRVSSLVRLLRENVTEETYRSSPRFAIIIELRKVRYDLPQIRRFWFLSALKEVKLGRPSRSVFRI